MEAEDLTDPIKKSVIRKVECRVPLHHKMQDKRKYQ